MNYKKIILISLIIIYGAAAKANGEPGINGDFVIFTSYTGNPLYDELIRTGEYALLETCYRAGRLVPVEFHYKKAAIEKSEGADRDNLYRNTAVYLKVGIYAVITSYNENGFYVLRLKLVPLNDKYRDLECEKTVRAHIPENIPLKAAREFAGLLKGVSLKSDILEIYDDGSALINSGQWHGLEIGSYSTDAGTVNVKNISRYRSVVKGANFADRRVIDFKLFPQLDSYIKKIDYDIRINTAKVYSRDEFLNKRDGAVKGAIQGTCLINQGASFCLPGYGSYLSLDYMGIENGEPDYAGIFITLSLTALHLGLVPALTDFDVMFLPWVSDNDRTVQMKRLNYFLWGTIPLTFSVSFFSQLEYNYMGKRLLPPKFEDPDISAAVVSVFIPGGGMFYKGYRWTGWGVYLGEMSLAGYAVYEGDSSRRNRLLCSLAVFKLAEIAASYYAPVSYPWFNRELSSSGDVDFSIGLNKNSAGGGEFTASASFRY